MAKAGALALDRGWAVITSLNLGQYRPVSEKGANVNSMVGHGVLSANLQHDAIVRTLEICVMCPKMAGWEGPVQ